MGRKSHSRTLGIWINGTHAADWRIPRRGDVELQYTPQWVEASDAAPLSISLPFTLENSPIKGAKVAFYFDNLLPDSDAIRQRIQSRYKTHSRDAFDLLAVLGRECVGAIQLLPEGTAPTNVHRIDAEELSEADVERALIQVTAPPPPGGIPEEDFRISIAGAQEKSAFLLHHGKWCRPIGATPTSHIFKLPLGLVGGVQADMSGSVENEWLCARILAAFGIPIAKCEIGKFGSQKALVVERFDRNLHESGKFWLRLVQEDFCQALALPHTMKYENEGGPGIKEVADLLRNSFDRDRDLDTFFRAQLIFWLLAAGDGHAKNFSLRLLPDMKFHLTPLYDVLSYWPIIGNAPRKIQRQKVRMAMAQRGKSRHYLMDEIQRRHFNMTAKLMGIGQRAEPAIEDILNRTPKVVDAVQRDLPSDFPQAILEPILAGLTEQSKRLQDMASA